VNSRGSTACCRNIKRSFCAEDKPPCYCNVEVTICPTSGCYT
jgi:hypothetical protein